MAKFDFMLVRARDLGDIVFYPYDTALVCGGILHVNVEDEADEREYIRAKSYLCKNATHIYDRSLRSVVKVNDKNQPYVDNKVTFKVGNIFYHFHDWSLWIGDRIEIIN